VLLDERVVDASHSDRNGWTASPLFYRD
jgi:hypothetical protein